MATAHTIPAATHGRYLVQNSGNALPPLDQRPTTNDRASDQRPATLLVGFHGYAEDAEVQLERLRSIPGSDSCLLVSLQGLHRFYRGRSQDVVASWMTRQDRELSIADNLAYVAAVMASVGAPGTIGQPVIFAGFSQGVAMAFRAACATAPARPSAVVALGGELPPELDRTSLSGLRQVLIGCGERDQFYSSTTADRDAARLGDANVTVTRAQLDAAHEWTPEFARAAGEFIAGFIESCGDAPPRSSR